MRIAQTEIGVLVGLFLLLSVVVYYAYTTNLFSASPLPLSIQQKQHAVHNSMISLIRKGANEVLKDMETHGGYPSSQLEGLDGVVFLRQFVPYWQKCDKTDIPPFDNITSWFEKELENYIKNHIKEVTDVYGSNVSFNLTELWVNIDIRCEMNRIDITVVLPTKTNGYAMDKRLYPYKTFIPTKFGEIYCFASDFSGELADKRYLEIFTISSIYLSKDTEDGHPKLPTLGLLKKCGETIYRAPEEISNALKGVVLYTLTHILWWTDMFSDSNLPKTYAIKNVGGRTYPDLKIRFHLPDDFEFETHSPIVITNSNIVLRAMLPFIISDCTAVYSQTYSLEYPVVISVYDSLSKHKFYFASLVFIDSNESHMFPGKCENIGEGEGACEGLECTAEIKVVDSEGNPLSGAVAVFGECPVGRSNTEGIIRGGIECGIHHLVIFYNESYDFINETVSSDEINNTYVLYRIPNMTAHFRKVDITERGYVNIAGELQSVSQDPCSGTYTLSEPKMTVCRISHTNNLVFVTLENGNQYVITNINPENMNENCWESDACQECYNSHSQSKCEECLRLCAPSVKESVNVNYVPKQTYTITADMLTSGVKEAGWFETMQQINEDTKDVYLNVPEISDPDYELTEGQKSCLASKLSECEISPVSEHEQESFVVSTKCDCLHLHEMVSLCGSLDSYFEYDQLAEEWKCNINEVINKAKELCGIKVVCK